MSSGCVSGELIVRMKTRHLQLALQTQVGHQRIANLEELVVLDEVVEHPRMNQQSGFKLRRVGGLQAQAILLQILEQARG